MWITSMGNHGAAGGISERRHSSCSSLDLIWAKFQVWLQLSNPSDLPIFSDGINHSEAGLLFSNIQHLMANLCRVEKLNHWMLPAVLFSEILLTKSNTPIERNAHSFCIILQQFLEWILTHFNENLHELLSTIFSWTEPKQTMNYQLHWHSGHTFVSMC